MWLCVAGSASAQALPLITVQEGSVSSAWWSVPQGALAPVERALLVALQGRGAAVLDPDALRPRPAISRIYRSPGLTAPNAVNVGGLLGSRQVLVGVVSLMAGDGPAGTGLRGVEARAAVSLRAVPSGVVLLEIQMARQAFDPEEGAARERALASLGADLGDLVAGAQERAQAPLGPAREEPFVLVQGLWDRGALRALQRGLEGLEGVEEARLSWVAEGLAAFDINPAREDRAGEIARLCARLSQAPPAGMSLRALPDEGPGALRAERSEEAGDE